MAVRGEGAEGEGLARFQVRAADCTLATTPYFISYFECADGRTRPRLLRTAICGRSADVSGSCGFSDGLFVRFACTLFALRGRTFWLANSVGCVIRMGRLQIVLNVHFSEESGRE